MRKTADHCLFQKDVIFNQYPKLDNDIQTQVLIIGGGVTGALTAYLFNKHNIDCVLIEKDTVGTGSTLGSTSLLHYEIDIDIQRLSAFIGEENATIAFKTCLEAVGQLQDIINQLDDPCDFVLRPSFYYTTKQEEYDYLFDEYKLRKNKGFDVTFFDGKKDIDKFSFPYVAGIFSENSGAEVNPVKLTNALLNTCHQNKMPIYEKTEIIEYDLENEKPVAVTKDGYKITCNKVIIACGYDNLPFIDESLYSMTRTFILATKPVEEFLGWHQRCLIKDTNDLYTYLRTTMDNRIIIGGEDIEVSLFDEDKLNMEDNHGLATQKYHLLKKKLEDYFPLIQNKEIEYAYNGIFVDSKDGLPYLGEHIDYPNVYFNTAIGSNGLLYGLIGGNLIFHLYTGTADERMQLFGFNR